MLHPAKASPMKTFTLLLAISLTTYYTGHCQPMVSSNEHNLALAAISEHSEPSLEEELIDLEKSLFQAERTSNAAIADSVLAANYKEVYPDGYVMSRERKLELIEQRPRKDVTDFTFDEFNIDTYGNSAVMTYLRTININDEQTVHTRVMATYIKEDDRWRTAGKQISAIMPLWSIRDLRDDELEVLSPLDCQDEAELKSLLTSYRSLIWVKNDTGEDIKIHWINFKGERDPNPFFNRTLASGKSSEIDTFVTHSFVISKASGECIGIYRATINPGLVVIK